MIDLTTLDFSRGNERDVEIPYVLDRVSEYQDQITSLLDMGSHYAWFTYGEQLRQITGKARLDGVDILEDPKTAQIYDHYYVGDIQDKTIKRLQQYDCVISISSLEHSGISTYKKPDWKAEQRAVFKKMYETAKKYLFVTFPFGMPALDPGQFGMIDQDQFWEFAKLTKEFIMSDIRFLPSFYIRNEDKTWREVTMEEAAGFVYDPGKGVECICCLQVIKK